MRMRESANRMDFFIGVYLFCCGMWICWIGVTAFFLFFSRVFGFIAPPDYIGFNLVHVTGLN